MNGVALMIALMNGLQVQIEVRSLAYDFALANVVFNYWDARGEWVISRPMINPRDFDEVGRHKEFWLEYWYATNERTEPQRRRQALDWLRNKNYQIPERNP